MGTLKTIYKLRNKRFCNTEGKQRDESNENHSKDVGYQEHGTETIKMVELRCF